jgi:hypothetical protein
MVTVTAYECYGMTYCNADSDVDVYFSSYSDDNCILTVARLATMINTRLTLMLMVIKMEM